MASEISIYENESFFYQDNTTDASIITPAMELQFAYTFLEVLVAIVAVIGNAMVIVVFRKERRLRRRTNYYIVSLAVADLLVGLLGIPFAIMASIGLPRNLHACLFTVSLLIVLCTISIFCLVAVSVDRYWAILHPMGYSRNVRTKTAIIIISLCWVAGSVVGFLPLFGWHAGSSNHLSCFFVQVMDYNFLVFLYIGTIITPSLVLAAFYTHIYRVVVKQLRQIVTMNPAGSCRNAGGGGGTMLRVLGAAQKREVKATQNLAIIVLFFMICWIPLYTINCVKAFCPDCHIGATWTDFCIILSHLNSAVNPLLYAYHLRDFRAALKSLIYKMFGLKETGIPNDNYYKPSIVSNKNKQSTIEKRSSLINSHQTKIYVDSPVWLRQRAAEMSVRAPSPVFQESSLSCFASPNKTYHRKGREDLWMISEVPSVSGGERERTSKELPNEGHESLQEFPENDDDDVFLPSPAQLYSVTRYDFPGDEAFATELPFRESPEIQMEKIPSANDSPAMQEVDNSFNDTNHVNGSSEKLDAFNKKFVSIFSSTPSQVLFFVGNEGVYNASDIGVQTNDTKHCASVSISPTKSLRLSPLKKVGDYIFNQNSNISFKGGTFGDYKKRKRHVLSSSSTDIFQYLDLHRNGTLPLRHSGESVHQHS